jgi:hypothetical protein
MQFYLRICKQLTNCKTLQYIYPVVPSLDHGDSYYQTAIGVTNLLAQWPLIGCLTALFQVIKDVLLITTKEGAGLEQWAWLKVAIDFQKKGTTEEKKKSTKG